MQTVARTMDPITFEIISHRLYEITKEMGITLERVGGTVNTTQMKDYLSALYLPNGDVLTVGHSGISMHAVCAGFAVKRIIERFGKEGEIYSDDMFLLNDPYLAAIHQSDMYMISPIHYEDQLMGWSATFVHVMDIGAMSPGGNSPEATEICHEGVRIPGIKLMEKGKLRKDVFDTIINMTRQPVMVGLDLKCEIAANNVAKARMQEMIKQYGTEMIHSVSSQMIRYTESVLRKRIQGLPDGSWDDTALIQADDTWKVKLTLKKKADRLIFDFTGSDRQAKRGINLPYHATFGSCYGVVLAYLGYDIPRNSGAFYPIEVIAPEGSVVNVKSPGPVSLNTTSGAAAVRYLAASVLLQALARSNKWKNEVMAQSTGGRFIRHAGISQYRRYYVSTLYEAGGNGAASYKDGINSANLGMSCHNVEWVELNFPLLFLFRRHVMDGGGAGKFRGGAGLELVLKIHDAAEENIKGIALGVAGLKNSGQGVFGGYPAAPSLIALLEDMKEEDIIDDSNRPFNLTKFGGKAKLLPYCEFELKRPDFIYMRTSSGGGYGDPLDREPTLVLSDAMNGLVSREAARKMYAVELNGQGQGLDKETTQTLRIVFRANRLKGLKTELKKGNMQIAPPMETPGTIPQIGEGISLPLRENVEFFTDDSGTWIRCMRCLYKLSQGEDDWTKAAAMRRLPPTEAGPLMEELVGHFLLEQILCPNCYTLLDTKLVEERNNG